MHTPPSSVDECEVCSWLLFAQTDLDRGISQRLGGCTECTVGQASFNPMVYPPKNGKVLPVEVNEKCAHGAAQNCKQCIDLDINERFMTGKSPLNSSNVQVCRIPMANPPPGSCWQLSS